MVTTSNHLTFTSPLPRNLLRFHPRRQRNWVSFKLGVVNGESSSSLRLSTLAKKGRKRDADLEGELLEFMENSKNPDSFPTKKDLVEAGRVDLVEAILEKGDWFCFGWDYSVEESERGEENGVLNWGMQVNGSLLNDDDNRILQQSLDGDNGEIGSLGGLDYPPSSSGSVMESEEEQEQEEEKKEGGIEGILSRLDKERRFTFMGGSRDRKSKGRVTKKDEEDDGLRQNSSVAGSERSSKSTSPRSTVDSNDSPLKFNGPIKPDTWRTWSSQRISSSKFEAAEIGEISNNDEATEMTPSQMKSRIQNLELELATVLCLLRNQTNEELNESKENLPGEPHKLSNARKFQQTDLYKLSDTLELPETDFHELSDTREFQQTDLHKLPDTGEFQQIYLHKLSDAGEFQQTEVMNARDQLRSLRAKLAVVSGKMAMTIIEAQKIVKLKQKKINEARKTLSLLRSACIIWPNSASEVLLTGSFDGWTTQRRMERSSSGIFSLSLMLYPGRYEIKFIVDGVWMIDPLRPIVKVDGYENNLLEVF
ncbi:hypothetical protein GIB67_029222 [Kingdonia uniflora]|uniref:AMP-activated protein kinase glycogen-binding domain-containing protein n=1 Tax=Kingdonia uniflora TaxID=39325 RepID=A0A7J7NAQ2_9MAGN|nr:hypothetical protein GIB67_029222 [Kingdonia uniflora]